MHDLTTIRHQHRTNQPADLSGYEPILEVEIPGTPKITERGNDLTVDFKPETGADSQIRAVGKDSYRDHITEQIEADPTLQRLLVNNHHQTDIPVPSVDQATRSVINPSTSLLTGHPLVTQLPEKYRQAGALLLEYLLKYHEIGTREAAGGHFTSVIDPETLVLGEHLPWSDMLSVIDGKATHTRAVPMRYHEVRATLEERRILDSLVDSEQAIVDALRTTAGHMPGQLEVALKDVKLERLNELLADWETYFDTHRSDEITAIVHTLEAEIDRERAIDLLHVPQEAVMHPSKWLCHLLFDLQNGHDPSEIRWHGSYWETTHHGDDETFETVRERTSQRRNALIDNPVRRGSQSTYELVTITEDTLVRRWYSYKPTDTYNLKHIRYGLVVQQLFDQLRRAGIRIINTGSKPASYVYSDGERPFNAAGYQLEGINPFEAVTTGAATPADIGRYFQYKTNHEASYRAWEYGRNQTKQALGFNSITEMVDWIGGKGSA